MGAPDPDFEREKWLKEQDFRVLRPGFETPG
jgi:hypothetical protein